MDNFIKQNKEEFLIILNESSERMGLSPNIIEKDLWVCWVLKCLYSIPEIAPYIIFKGGTSLSKAYNLIDRFSEDCDITINKKILGLLKDPKEENISNKEIVRRVDGIILAAQDFIKNNILTSLRKEMGNFLDSKSYRLDLEDDLQTILFSYPSCFRITGDDKNNLYIKPTIRLEFGARGGTIPKEDKYIKPYIAEIFPNLFKQSRCLVPVLSAERTFWEKITILHSLYHKHIAGKKIGHRMSRHYYDVYILNQKGISENALKEKDLLKEVTKNNMIFFKDNNVSYETSAIGTLKLCPSDEMRIELKKDYNDMQEMFMHEQISFEDIINNIYKLEQEINNLVK